MTTSWLIRGRPRQFCVMWQNIRCSILFHLGTTPLRFAIVDLKGGKAGYSNRNRA